MGQGRLAKFSYEDVAQACEQLQENGKLTLEEVRRHLGGGSNTTLLIHYQTWKRQQAEQHQAAPQFPAAVSRILNQALKGIFNEGKKHAQDQLLELEQTCTTAQHMLAELETATATISANHIAQLAEHKQQYQQMLAEAEQAKTAHQHQQQQLQEQLQTAAAAYQKQISAKEALLQLLERQQHEAAAQIERLHHDYRSCQQDLQVHSIKAAVAERELLLQQNNHNLTQKEHHRQLTMLQTALQKSQEHLENVQNEIHELRRTCFAQTTTTAVWKERALTAEAARHNLFVQVHDLRLWQRQHRQNHAHSV